MYDGARTSQGPVTRGLRSFAPSKLGLLVALALVAAACSNSGSTTTAVPDTAPLDLSGELAAADDSPFIHRPVDRVAPAFTLTDQNGEVVSLSDFAGKWVVVDWVFTNCVTFCPLLTGEMNLLNHELGDVVGNEIQMITISFDPLRDTPQVLQDHSLTVTGGGEGWSWLTGTQEETDAVAAAYGVSYDPSDPVGGIGQFDHTSLMVIIGPDGKEKHRYLGIGWWEDAFERLNAEALGLAPPPPVAAVEPPSVAATEPPQQNAGTAELLTNAIALPWEEFELELGVSSQVLYQFPSSGEMEAYVDQVADDAMGQGVEVKRLLLSAMKVRLIKWAEGRAVGIGYDTNLAVTVEGESSAAVLDALSVLDNEWCCGTAGA